MNQTDKQFIADVCEVLDQSIEDLDGPTQIKLRQARQDALRKRPAKYYSRLFWGIASGATALIILAAVMLPVQQKQLSITGEMKNLTLLTSEDSLELYDHDIEFYLWLSDVMDEKQVIPDNSGVDDDTKSAVSG